MCRVHHGNLPCRIVRLVLRLSGARDRARESLAKRGKLLILLGKLLVLLGKLLVLLGRIPSLDSVGTVCGCHLGRHLGRHLGFELPNLSLGVSLDLRYLGLCNLGEELFVGLVMAGTLTLARLAGQRRVDTA